MFTSLNTGAIGFSAPFEEAAILAQNNDFAGLDLSLPELARIVEQTSLQALKERFYKSQLLPGAWNPPIDFRGPEETYRKELAALPGYAALAQALGSSRCATWILPFSDELDFAANMQFHVTRLRPIAQILADYGCRLGLEFVGPQTLRAGHKYEFISTITGALELGQQIGTGNLGLLLDSFHWYTSHARSEDIRQLTNQQIVYVHVNDAVAGREVDEQLDKQRLLPGTSGVIDIVGFLQTLEQIGYDGPVVVEPFDKELSALPNEERVRKTKASLDKIWKLAGLS